MLGERNTRFYHLLALKRRRRNKINTLKILGDLWSTDNDEIKEHVNSYFINQFTSEGERNLGDFNDSLSPKILEQDGIDLSRPITFEETTCALKSMKPDKAPGPDGFQASFFKNTGVLLVDE